MYICICNGIREQDLRQVARSGALTTRQAYAELGIETACARCVTCAQDIIDDELCPLAEAG